MRKLLFTIVLTLLFFTSISYSLTNIGFNVGLSTPNDQINNVYNSNDYTSTSVLYKLFREGISSGYHIGAVGRFDLIDKFSIVGGIAWHKFPQTEIEVIDPTSGDTVASLETSQNIIPITVGVNFYLIRSILGVYGTGQLTYNYISNSVDYNYKNVPISLNQSPTDHRVGFGLGAGIDIDAILMTLNLEAKYNIINLIGKTNDEKTKSYFSLSLGVLF